MKGYVIFSSEAAFNTAHEAAKTKAGLPRVGNVNGVPAPENQQTVELTSYHPTSWPADDTVVAFVDGGWPGNLKDGFVYKAKEDVTKYFPDEVE